MSVPEQSIGDILSGKEPEAIPVETADTDKAVEATGEKAAPPAADQDKQKVEDKQAPARDESGKFKATEKVEEKPAEKPRADVAAIIDERRKRQAAEARLRELEGGGKQPRASVLEDEDKAFDQRINEGTRGLREQNYKLSVKLARMEHGDAFAEAETAFAEAAERDDRLYAGLRASDDPGEYIYSVGLQIKELADVGGDFMKYRQKVTADLNGKLTEREERIKALESELEATKKAKQELESLPTSLNSKGSQVSSKDVPEDESLKSLVRFGNKQR